MEDSNYFNKKFPNLNKITSLSKIEFILITYAICITLYTRLSYNALAIRIGEQILDYIYYKNIIKKEKKSSEAATATLLPRQIQITKKEFIDKIGFSTTIDLLKLGDFYMSILQQFPHDIFSRKIKLDSFYTNEPYLLEINKDFIEDLKKNIIINPQTLPMICKPNP